MIIQPPIRMARDLMPTLPQRLHDRGVFLQRLPHGVAGDGHGVRVEEVEHAPDAHPRAVLVVGFDVERSFARAAWPVAGLFVEGALARGVAVQDAAFGALGLVSVEWIWAGMGEGLARGLYFFVVDHEADSDFRAAGPCGVRGMATVADEVAWEVELRPGVRVGVCGVKGWDRRWSGHIEGLKLDRHATSKICRLKQIVDSQFCCCYSCHTLSSIYMMSLCIGQTSWPIVGLSIQEASMARARRRRNVELIL